MQLRQGDGEQAQLADEQGRVAELQARLAREEARAARDETRQALGSEDRAVVARRALEDELAR